MKEIRTFWKYKYSVEMEPKVSLTVNEAERSSNITWDFHIDLMEYPDGLTNDMVRWILNFIWEMEKSAIRESMKWAMHSFTIKDDSLSWKISNPYWWYNPPYWTLTYCNADDYSPAKQVEPTWMFNKPVMNTAW